MVTVQQVAEKTGVSTKTLSRWVAKGALPKPVIQTHSSGRGKEGVWPDQVLERCQRLAELRRNGHSLESAVATLETDRIRERLATLDGWTVADVLEGKSFDLPDGTKVKALQFLVSMIGKALKQSVVDRDCQQQILGELRHNNLVRAAVNMAAGGYNPVLTFDGRDTRIEPDFLLSQIHDAGGAMTRSIFMLPLWPTIHEFATAIGIGSHFPEPC
ncbi:MAG: MerR family transcriptional regulator, partial [Planctomycetaceae bacterium]|nr:MerR family transcriptional regulator [Planctomycetaceae bacterium]